jgi:fibronectin-binding autotransporter adhesin
LMELDPTATYTVNNNIAAGGTAGGDVWGSAGFIPVGGNDAPAFSGSFNGQNYTISGLTIDAPSLMSVGLFGVSVGGISNVALTGANITGGSYEAAVLAGENDGAVTGSSASGTVSSAGSYVGGLVGWSSDTMSSDSANVAVTLTGFGNGGGLVGENSGAVSQSGASGAVTTTYDQVGSGDIVGGLVGQNDEGTITTSWSSGAVTGPDVLAGGLVGDNLNAGASISDSYSLGSVVVGANSDAGGLVGYNETDGQIARSYAAGYVSGSGGSAVGGLVGVDNSTNGITNSYFDTETSGVLASNGAGNIPSDSGITGETTAQLMGTLPSGFSNATWGTGSGLLPYLLWQFPSGTPQSISGTVTNNGSTVIGASVTGASVNGIAATPAVSMSTGANGLYYLLLAPGTIAAGDEVLTYATGANAATLTENATGSLSGVTLSANALLLPTSDTAFSTLLSNLDTAIGSNTALQTFVDDLPNTTINISAANFVVDETLSATTLTLQSTGNVTQSAAIDAAAVDLVGTGGHFTLTNGGNFVDTLAANAAVVSFADDDDLTIGSVNGTNGITATGAVSLAVNGSISQTAAIDALSLTGSSFGGTTLNGANLIGTLNAFTNTSIGGFALTDDTSLTVNGAVSAGTGNLSLTTSGAGSKIILDHALTAGATVDLVSASTITQASGGVITATTLTGSSSGGTTLGKANLITFLGTFSNAGTGGIALTNGKTLTVNGAVNAGSGNLTLTTTGTGNLTLDKAITAGGTVDLVSGGTISQQVTGIITAATLAGSAADNTTLNKANEIGTLGTFTDLGGNFDLTDDQNLTITGTVKVGTHEVTLTDTGTLAESGAGQLVGRALTGSSAGGTALNGANALSNLNAFTNTGAGGFALTDGVGLTVAGAVKAGSGNLTLTTTGGTGKIAIKQTITSGATVDLVSAGEILQSSAGIITASALEGSSGGNTTLTAANQIGSLGAFTNTGGNFALTDDQNLAITGTLDAGTHKATLKDTGTLGESGAGLIEAGILRGTSTGGATLNGANAIADLDGFVNTGAGGFALTDGSTLTLDGAVGAGTGNLVLTTTLTGDNIDIEKALTAGGSVDLISDGKIAQTATGIITAGTLTGSAAGTVTLNSANAITNLGSFTDTSGNFALTDHQSLTIDGTVNVGSGNLTLQTTSGSLIVSAALDGHALTLGSTTGEVEGTGAITAALLNVTANTGIDLTGANEITALGTDQTNSGPNVIDGVE